SDTLVYEIAAARVVLVLLAKTGHMKIAFTRATFQINYHDNNYETPVSSQSIPQQMSMTFDTVELQGMSALQRANAIRYLARLLMQAAGISTPKGHDDDEC
ncbi:hypothetical protein, partial [Burkholderia alba]|uniref:hypothetical protein n=1 Tax=Burkholderia alba TaxID=2683677 RepID=UPI002B0604CA